MLQTDLSHKISELKNTGEVISQTLMEMIYEGRFKPGEPLRQDAIAELFGVSRVPVRDALNTLVARQLAISVPRKGIVVHPLSRRLIKELFQVRIILEGAAAELVLKNASSRLLTALREILAEQRKALAANDVKANEDLDNAFHRTMREVIGNRTLGELIEANWLRIKQARCASSMVLPKSGRTWIANSIARHERLIEAFEGGDPSAAREILTANIEGSYAEVVATLEELGWLVEEAL